MRNQLILSSLLIAIAACGGAKKGSVYGSEEFRSVIESQSGQKVRPRPRGRPRLRHAS